MNSSSTDDELTDSRFFSQRSKAILLSYGLGISVSSQQHASATFSNRFHDRSLQPHPIAAQHDRTGRGSTTLSSSYFASQKQHVTMASPNQQCQPADWLAEKQLHEVTTPELQDASVSTKKKRILLTALQEIDSELRSL
jgi:hypothetical protein